MNMKNNWMKPLRARWQAMAARDRLALVCLSAVLLVLGFWWGAWLPVQAALRNARADVVDQQALQAHLRSHAAQLASRGKAVAATDASALPALLTASAARRGLAVVLQPPRPDQSLSVTVQGAPTEVVAWLRELQDAGVATRQLRLSRDAEAGWQGEVVLAAAS